jgi:hypothetical protein
MMKSTSITIIIIRHSMEAVLSLALPRLLQLCSPALPVGAYAYSQGLEYAVERGWVRDEASAGDWILGLLNHSLRRLDLPIFVRLYAAWRAMNSTEIRRWNARLYASREAAELQREDQHLGAALARLLTDLGIVEAEMLAECASGVLRHAVQSGDRQMGDCIAGRSHRLYLGLGRESGSRRDPVDSTRPNRQPAIADRRRSGVNRRRAGRAGVAG